MLYVHDEQARRLKQALLLEGCRLAYDPATSTWSFLHPDEGCWGRLQGNGILVAASVYQQLQEAHHVDTAPVLVG